MLDPLAIGYVRTPDAVLGLAEAVRKAPRAAVDTEADSLHHYFEKVCLLQVSVPDGDFLVDPLEPELDLSPLMDALAGCPLLLFHGADYDLRMLRRDFGFEARAIFDTMSAAQLLGYERFSYAALVEKHLGLTLDKKGQKADWSKRPLKDDLIAYAAGDTHYLGEVADRMAEELAAAGRAHWHEEVCRRLLPEVSQGIREPDEDRQWRVKGWHGLKARGQAGLRAGWRWRDAEARKIDKPAFMVLRNESLIEMAAWAAAGRDPETRPKLPRNITGRRADGLFECVTDAVKLPDEELPGPPTAPRRGMPAPDDAMVAALKVHRDALAKELVIDPGVLLPGAALGAVSALRPTTVEELQAAGKLHDWQTVLMGEALLKIVDAHRGNPPAPSRRSRGGRAGRGPKTEPVAGDSTEAAGTLEADAG